MQSIAVGATFTLTSDRPTVAFFRLRPSDLRPGSERFSVTDEAGNSALSDTLVDLVSAGSDAPQHFDRVLLPAGASSVRYEALVEVERLLDLSEPRGFAPSVSELTAQQWWWLQPTRYCRPDQLGPEAWDRFGSAITPTRPAAAEVVQQICDFVNTSMTFEYGSSTPSTSAADAWAVRRGVCRDFNHVAVSFCRALNIPARYVFGYLPDIDVEPNPAPQDFCAWFEVLLDGAWQTFDARVNERRSGRIVIARGRDAADVPVLSTMGAVMLSDFVVRAEQVQRSPESVPAWRDLALAG